MLEILVGLSLTAVLLTLLFSFLVESAKLETKLDTARATILAREHLHMQLQTIFSSIDRSSLKEPFYTKHFPEEKGDSLVVLFDGGIDPDPAFSGSVVGRIYLDETNNLSLVTWPLDKEKRDRWRKEILLSQVERFEFEFLQNANSKSSLPPPSKKEKVRKVTAELLWRTQWPKARGELPSMIRLTVWGKQKEALQMAFLLPTPEPMVTYWEGGGSA